MREIALPQIVAGRERDPNSVPLIGTQNRPALALDRGRRIAYVISPSGLAAEVPLDTAVVRYHVLRGRFAKYVSGSARQALVVHGKIVVTGDESTTWTLPDGKPAMRTEPAGLELIDPVTWEARRLANDVMSVAPSREGFLATGASWSSVGGYGRGAGLVAYGADGSERFRVLAGKRIWVTAVYGGKAYVYVDGEQPVKIVDLETGGVVETPRQVVPWLLLEENAPVW